MYFLHTPTTGEGVRIGKHVQLEGNFSANQTRNLVPVSRVFLGYLSVFNLIPSVTLNLKIGYGDSHGPVISKELPSSLMGSRHFEFKDNIR